MMSAASGFRNNTWNGHPVGIVDSGYLRTYQANRCNFRDYQNVGVNGARSSSMLNIMKTMSRNLTDHPVFLAYALVGNDVCNGHHTMATMTTPQEFYRNVVGAMEYLDTILNAASHVIFLGLADGRVLYESVGERVHPIGALHGNVLYRDFYDFLNCLEISPCFGWMNSDADWRNKTSQRAEELNQVYQDIVRNNTYKNFDLHYFDCPLNEVVRRWQKQGGQVWQLIEPVDGFHPNQISEELTTQVLTELYEKEGIAPPVNPHNAEIQKMFGDQGGYDPVSAKKKKR